MKRGANSLGFKSINRGYNHIFRQKQLSIGLVVPIENYADSAIPSMHEHAERAQLAEALGFKAVWLRDVPFNVPSFGDAGQLFDPFVYLGFLAAQTETITLGVASIILPLRHPAHVAKALASVDHLSVGRIVVGVASGDRPEEYPAFNVSYPNRGALFRDSFEYIRKMGEERPSVNNHFGLTSGDIDLLPKPHTAELPLLITGGSQQSEEWIAQNGNGWMLYPRPPQAQANIIRQWRENIEKYDLSPKPVMEPLYIDLDKNPDTPPTPIHLGYRLGAKALRNYLKSRRMIGVNHVALNLRFNNADFASTLKTLSTELLPEFHEEG